MYAPNYNIVQISDHCSRQLKDKSHELVIVCVGQVLAHLINHFRKYPYSLTVFTYRLAASSSQQSLTNNHWQKDFINNGRPILISAHVASGDAIVVTIDRAVKTALVSGWTEIRIT